VKRFSCSVIRSTTVVWRKCQGIISTVTICFFLSLVLWCDLMWCDVTLCDVVWCDVMWCGVVSCEVRWGEVMWLFCSECSVDCSNLLCFSLLFFFLIFSVIFPSTILCCYSLLFRKLPLEWCGMHTEETGFK